mmetsp:Transcript_2908/g.10193  ORF Transcript_2908/g.10193 Transcript_2908/m.10193 type:complete len:203 (+) Transcript_2908:3174-3782(+)
MHMHPMVMKFFMYANWFATVASSREGRGAGAKMPLQHASLYVLAVRATPSSSNWIAALHGINSREFSRAHSSAIRVRRVGGGRGQRRAFVRLQGKCFIRVRFKKKKGKQLRRVLFPFGQREKTGARPRGNASPVRAPRQKLDPSQNPPPSGSRETRLCTLPVGRLEVATARGSPGSIRRELGVTRKERIAWPANAPGRSAPA